MYFTFNKQIDASSLVIDLSKFNCQNMGLANIKVRPVRPGLKWSYKINYGGSHFDCIDSCLTGEEPWMCANGRAIPFIASKYDNVRINFALEGNQELEVSYDIVKIADDVFSKLNEIDVYQYGVLRNSVINEINVNAMSSCFKMNYLSHPTYNIKIKTDKLVRNIFFKCSGKKITPFKYDIINNMWKLDFVRCDAKEEWSPTDKTVNLSRLDGEICVELVNETDEVKIEYCNFYWNCVKRVGQRTGFLYECS